MTLGFHEQHRVLPLAKYIQEREDDIEMEDIIKQGVKACVPPLLYESVVCLAKSSHG